MKRLALIITGDRNAETFGDVAWVWRHLITEHYRLLMRRYEHIVLIHGACGENAGGKGEMRGIDHIADSIAREYRPFHIMPMPAEWNTGTKAGPMRNARMLEIQHRLGCHGYDMLTHGYHDDLPRSKGTGGCIRESRQFGVETHAFRSDGGEWPL